MKTRTLLDFLGIKTQRITDDQLLHNVNSDQVRAIGARLAKGQPPHEIIWHLTHHAGGGGDYVAAESQFESAVQVLVKTARHMGLVMHEDIATPLDKH
jgi:hypothetical protein